MSTTPVRFAETANWALDDEPARLVVPRWLHIVMITNVGLVASVAAYMFMGGLVVTLVALPLVAAFALWLTTTYRRAISRRVIPFHLATILCLLLVTIEQWTQDYAGTLRELFPDAFAEPVVFSETLWVATFPVAGTALFLWGAAAVYYHHPIGHFLSWLLFCFAVTTGTSHYALGLVADSGPAYVPGMWTGVVPIALGLFGVRLLLRSRIEERRS